MDRRDFLLLRPAGSREAVLSCERLYMRYVDAEADGSTTDLLRALQHDLTRTRRVRVTDPEWLAADALKRGVEKILSEFTMAGGIVRIGNATRTGS